MLSPKTKETQGILLGKSLFIKTECFLILKINPNPHFHKTENFSKFSECLKKLDGVAQLVGNPTRLNSTPGLQNIREHLERREQLFLSPYIIG